MFGRGMHRGEHHGNHGHHHWQMFFDKSAIKVWKDKRKWDWHQPEEFLDQSSLNFLMLYLINEKPAYGYEIIKVIEEKFDGVYSPEPEDIYPSLAKLEDIGFLKSTIEEGKKIFSITEEGKAYIETNKEKIDAVLASIDKAKQSINGDIVREVFHAVKKIGLLVFEGYKEKNWGREQMKKLLEILERTANEIRGIQEIKLDKN